MRPLIAFLLVFALTGGVLSGGGLRAQELQASTSQEVANQLFDDLTESMHKLQALLAKSDDPAAAPDRRVLDGGLLLIRERKIRESMDLAKQMLEAQRWDAAIEKMQTVRKDLKQLLELLQNRNLDLQKLLEELAQLQSFRDEVDRLAKEQGEEKEDSARVEALQKQLEAIAAAKERTERILAEQKELREATNQLGMQAAAQATEPLASKEGELKEATEDLAKDLEKIERTARELEEAGKPGESQPGEGKPNEGEPGDGKPGEGKPGEGKPGEGKPSEGQPSEGQSGGCSSCAKGAAGSMQKAQQQLGQQKPESSLKDQDHAIQKLQSTLEQLDEMAEEARRDLLKLPFEQMAKEQEQTQHATDTLAQKMEQAEQEGEDGSGEPMPGRKPVQQAVPKQKAAAGTLKEYKPAKQKQQDAKEDLEQARDELDEAIAQLRQQLQDEVLRALEERFTAMLARQRELSLQTKTLDRTREQVLTADGSLPAALVERIQTIASGEQDLEVEASDALKLLQEEGTTAVFPEIVSLLKDQLHEVARRCRANETGKPVQERQAEVEDTLALLINSLRRTIERREGG